MPGPVQAQELLHARDAASYVNRAAEQDSGHTIPQVLSKSNDDVINQLAYTIANSLIKSKHDTRQLILRLQDSETNAQNSSSSNRQPVYSVNPRQSPYNANANDNCKGKGKGNGKGKGMWKVDIPLPSPDRQICEEKFGKSGDRFVFTNPNGLYISVKPGEPTCVLFEYLQLVLLPTVHGTDMSIGRIGDPDCLFVLDYNSLCDGRQEHVNTPEVETCWTRQGIVVVFLTDHKKMTLCIGNADGRLYSVRIYERGGYCKYAKASSSQVAFSRQHQSHVPDDDSDQEFRKNYDAAHSDNFRQEEPEDVKLESPSQTPSNAYPLYTSDVWSLVDQNMASISEQTWNLHNTERSKVRLQLAEKEKEDAEIDRGFQSWPRYNGKWVDANDDEDDEDDEDDDYDDLKKDSDDEDRYEGHEE